MSQLKLAFWPTFCWIGVGIVYLLMGPAFTGALAQTTSPITSSGLNTQVSEPVSLPTGETQHNITGGTRPGGGANLFHSFGEFGVPENHIGNFQNDSGMPTSNILGRVTGGNTSNVFGTIQTEGFGAANLFLMNPAGWVFGPNAALNVGGSVNFTTADYIRHSDGSLFMALSPDQDSQLSIAPIAAFGFLEGSAGTITVQGSTLTVDQGQNISLVSGDISIESVIDVPEGENPIGSTINAPGGDVRLVSVASGGEVGHSIFNLTPNLNGEAFTDMGTISLSEGAVLDASGEAAGTVSIRGGELVMTNAVISADTGNENGAPVAIDIDVASNVSISTVDSPALTARTTGTGNAGEIKLSSGGAMDISGFGFFEILVPIIDTHTSGPGNAGNVTITAEGDLTATGDENFFSLPFLASTGTDGFDTGKGGDLTITARNFESNGLSISTGNFFSFFNFGEGAGSAGDVTISADESINLFFTDIITDSFDFFFNTGGNAGNVTLDAPQINFDLSNISTAGWFRGGNVNINTDFMTLFNSGIVTQTRTQPGGAVTITGRVIELTEGSNIVSTTNENADAGDITITASERVSLLNSDIDDRPNGILSNTFPLFGEDSNFGNSGNVLITTPILEMTGGSRINTTTQSNGNGGDVKINAQLITLSGETNNLFPDGLLGIGQFQPSGIFTRSIGEGCVGPCGDAGNVTVNTVSLVMEKGAQINSGTSSEGKGGDITVNATEMISISGTLNDGNPGGMLSRTIGTLPDSGSGGNISLTSGGSFSLSDGAAISADSTGLGNSGMVRLETGGNVKINNGTIATSATQAKGGDISVTAGQELELVNKATVLAESFGAGDSGSVTLTAKKGNFQSNNSTVSTSAQEAQGGDIEITARQTVELMNDTTVRAESFGPGDSGTVTIVAMEGNFQSNDSTVSTSAQEAQGGDIDIISGGNVDLDDTTISAESSGPKNAGDIDVTAGNDIEMTSSTISTEAAEASGGNIKLSAPNIIELTDSRIESSVLGGQATEGGNIDLDPVFIILNNSQILANATEGNGGNITLTATGAVFIDANSVLDASSETGISGNVTVNSPVAALAEVVAALPKNFVIPQSLFADACAAQAGGQFSSFTQGAPAALPPAPGGFLSSPLMLNNLSTPPSTGGMTSSSTIAQSRLGLDFSTITLLPAFGCGA